MSAFVNELNKHDYIKTSLYIWDMQKEKNKPI